PHAVERSARAVLRHLVRVLEESRVLRWRCLEHLVRGGTARGEPRDQDRVAGGRCEPMSLHDPPPVLRGPDPTTLVIALDERATSPPAGPATGAARDLRARASAVSATWIASAMRPAPCRATE